MVDRFAFPEASWKINQFGNWVRIADYEAVEKKANDASAQLEACRSLNASLRVDIEALRARLETVEAETIERAVKRIKADKDIQGLVRDLYNNGALFDVIDPYVINDARAAISQEGS